MTDTNTKPETRSNRCPRCTVGFIVFEGFMDGEGSCMNCGHHVQSNLAKPDDLLSIHRLLNPVPAIETESPEPLRGPRRSRRQLDRTLGLDL